MLMCNQKIDGCNAAIVGIDRTCSHLEKMEMSLDHYGHISAMVWPQGCFNIWRASQENTQSLQLKRKDEGKWSIWGKNVLHATATDAISKYKCEQM
jgi:hypothetical protein